MNYQHRLYALILLLACAFVGAAQNPSAARRLNYGTALPATCDPTSGEVFIVVKVGGTPASQHFCSDTNTWTELDATGGKQPLDSDLTAIAAIAPANDDLLQRKAGVWTNRTPAQFKTDLALVKGDVGLGNVDNTSDATKNSATATLTNKTLTEPAIGNFTNATHSHQNATGGGTLDAAALASGTLAAARMPALTGDVTTNAGSTSTTLANSGASPGTYTNATVTVNAKGLVTSVSSAAEPQGADVYHNVNISIPTGDPHTKLPLNSEARDTYNLHSTVTNNSRVTVGVSGWYTINAGVIWLPNAGGGGSRYVGIFINGAERGTPAVIDNASTTVGTYQTATALLYLTAGDYIEIDVYQSAGSATSVYASGGSPTLRLVQHR